MSDALPWRYGRRRAVHEFGWQPVGQVVQDDVLGEEVAGAAPARPSHTATCLWPRRRTRCGPSGTSTDHSGVGCPPALTLACGPSCRRRGRARTGPGVRAGDAGEPGAEPDARLLGDEHAGRPGRRRAGPGRLQATAVARTPERSSPAQPTPVTIQPGGSGHGHHSGIGRRSARGASVDARCADDLRSDVLARRAAAGPGRSRRTAIRCASGPAAATGRRTADSSPRHPHHHGPTRDRARQAGVAHDRERSAGRRPACARIQACMAIPLATPALIERVEPYWAMEKTWSQAARAGSDRPGPSWPNSSTHRRGRVTVSSGAAPGRLSMPITGSPAPCAQATNSSIVVVVPHVLVAVGDHGAAPVPPAPADDVHLGGEERVGVADHRADVEVVLPVLDRDVEVVPAGVQVGDDRLVPPVAVAVDDVAPVAGGEQLRVVAGRPPATPGPRPDADLQLVLGGRAARAEAVPGSPCGGAPSGAARPAAPDRRPGAGGCGVAASGPVRWSQVKNFSWSYVAQRVQQVGQETLLGRAAGGPAEAQQAAGASRSADLVRDRLQPAAVRLPVGRAWPGRRARSPPPGSSPAPR